MSRRKYSIINSRTPEFVKYCIVGGGNTLLTAVVIMTLTFFGLSLFLSNAIGYVVGIIFSFVMNSIFTFKKESLRSKSTKVYAGLFHMLHCQCFCDENSFILGS